MAIAALPPVQEERIGAPNLSTGAEEVAAAKAAIAILQMANQQGWLDKLKDLFRAKHRVLILGSTGVGKTNFIKSLRSLVPQAIDHLIRTEWATSQRLQLAGSIFDLTDTPGQDAYRPRRLEAVTNVVGKDSPFAQPFISFMV